MTSATITINREQLFRNVCQLTLYVSENMKDGDGVSMVERYRVSDSDRPLYSTLEEDAFYDLYDRCQILFRFSDASMDITDEAFIMKVAIPSNLPLSMVSSSLTKALTSLIMAAWFSSKGEAGLQEKYEGQASIDLHTVKSRILSRNTQQITYRAY